jgi:hypothetical protein
VSLSGCCGLPRGGENLIDEAFDCPESAAELGAGLRAPNGHQEPWAWGCLDPRVAKAHGCSSAPVRIRDLLSAGGSHGWGS